MIVANWAFYYDHTKGGDGYYLEDVFDETKDPKTYRKIDET